MLGCIDFHGIATLIDAVAGVEPQHLSALLEVLATSSRRLEARIVAKLAVRCRDPLAPLGTLCRDALQAAADLKLLERSSDWQSVHQVCPDARAGALLNLCDAALANDLHTLGIAAGGDRRRRCRAIRPRLKLAAAEESKQLQPKVDADRAGVVPL